LDTVRNAPGQSVWSSTSTIKIGHCARCPIVRFDRNTYTHYGSLRIRTTHVTPLSGDVKVKRCESPWRDDVVRRAVSPRFRILFFFFHVDFVRIMCVALDDDDDPRRRFSGPAERVDFSKTRYTVLIQKLGIVFRARPRFGAEKWIPFRPVKLVYCACVQSRSVYAFIEFSNFEKTNSFHTRNIAYNVMAAYFFIHALSTYVRNIHAMYMSVCMCCARWQFLERLHS